MKPDDYKQILSIRQKSKSEINYDKAYQKQAIKQVVPIITKFEILSDERREVSLTDLSPLWSWLVLISKQFNLK